MAFQKVTDYNEARFGNFFLLRNDGDFADVIFLYRSRDDELVGPTHYIKSEDYSGYVQCLGNKCSSLFRFSLLSSSLDFHHIF